MTRGAGWICALAAHLLVAGCMSAEGKTRDEQLAFALQKERELFGTLEAKDPELYEAVLGGAGHATFFYRYFKLPLVPTLGVGGGSGYGVVTDHRTHESRLMSYTREEWGWGTTLPTSASLVMVFRSARKLDAFLDGQWDFESGFTAAAKAGGEGVDIGTSSALLKEDVIAVELVGTGAGVGVTVRSMQFRVR